MENKDHKTIAITCFNEAWNYLDKEDLNNSEKVELLHLVHTSRYHWDKVGTITHRARGEWQISRAYSKLKLFDAALLHANVCMALTVEGELGGFDLPFAYEAVARAKAGLGLSYKEELQTGIYYAEKIENQADKDYTLTELKSVK